MLKIIWGYQTWVKNELLLFAEIGDRKDYSVNILGCSHDYISFDNINNLYHPCTIDACYAHEGHGTCGGVKKNGTWNLDGHKNRIVHYTINELTVLRDTFEPESDPKCVKLACIHDNHIINILKAIALFPSLVKDYQRKITEAYHETNCVIDGITKIYTHYPGYDNYEMIFSGPHVFVGTPYYKNPRAICVNKADYDPINLNTIDDYYLPRTKFTRAINISEYKSYIPGFVLGQDENGSAVYDNWIDYYKVGMRKMLNLGGERTLIGAILPPKCSHTNGIISTVFKDNFLLVEFAGIVSSIVMDFFINTIGSHNLTDSRMVSFPLGISNKFRPALLIRTLMLNCLTKYYADLWEKTFMEEMSSFDWSLLDNRLTSITNVTSKWSHNNVLHNAYERRMALVEIDVITAMALGLSLDDLILIYTSQFAVLQQNEDDTWYDNHGNIVFTRNVGLSGVGMERNIWEDIRGEQIDENTYTGTAPTYVHTIDPKKSELYGGQQVTYYAPYTRCDRIADYHRAWAHFEKIFNK